MATEASSIPFLFSLSRLIYRSVVSFTFRSFFPTKFLSLFFFYERIFKIVKANFRSWEERYIYREKVYLDDPSIHLENKSEVGGLSGYCRVELSSPSGYLVDSPRETCVFLLRKRDYWLDYYKICWNLEKYVYRVKNSVNRWKYFYSVREKV